jgi:hypothetical protein
MLLTLQVVQYTIKPSTGFAIASIWALVILGGKNPWVVDSISKTALGEIVILLLPTFSLVCAFTAPLTTKSSNAVPQNLLIFKYIVFLLKLES